MDSDWVFVKGDDIDLSIQFHFEQGTLVRYMVVHVHGGVRQSEALPLGPGAEQHLAIAERAATMRASRRATGRPVTQADMLIAATAAIHGSALATRNERDFEGLAVEIVNPFRPA